MELQIHVRRARSFLFHSLSLGSASLDADALELRVQCTINGELRSSGSGKRIAKTKHADGYIWRQDTGAISWYLTTKELKALKSKAPTLKLYVFAIGDEVHSLGWFFMDLRTPDTALRWIKLVNSKYAGEIQVSSQLRRASSPLQSTAPATAMLQESSHALPPTPSPDDEPEDDCLVIGDRPDAIYVLSIVVEGAMHMGPMVEALLKRCSPLELQAILAKGFWLSYSIFDVVVQTDVFHSLDVAGFDVIRDSFRLKSSLPALTAMLNDMNVLPMFLCTVDRILCRIEIPVAAWLPRDAQGPSPPDRFVLAGPYTFLPSHETKDIARLGQVQASMDLVLEGKIPDTRPADSAQAAPKTPDAISFLHMTLLHEDHGNDDGAAAPLPAAVVRFCGIDERVTFDTTYPDPYHRQGVVVHSGKFTKRRWPTSTESADLSTPAQATVHVEGQLVATADIAPRASAAPEDTTRLAVLRNAQGDAVGEVGYSVVSVESDDLSPDLPLTPEMQGTYTLQVDVVSIKRTAAGGPVESVVRVHLVHPFYKGPTLASDPVSLAGTAQQDVVGLDSIRFFHVATSQLHVPVTFDVVAVTPDDAPHLGQAMLSLQYLLHATVLYECNTCGESLSDWTAPGHVHMDEDGGRRRCLYRPYTTCDVYVPVMKATAQVAILHVRAKWVYPDMLSDEAAIETVDASAGNSTTAGAPVAPMQPPRPTSTDVPHPSPPPPSLAVSGAAAASDPTKQAQGCACGAALQRERALFAAERKAWDVAKKKHQAALDQAEAKRMETLEAEWALREKERIQTVREAQQEYMALEKKLRQTLHDLDVRERALAKAEEAFQHKLALQKQEMDIVQRKTKSETQHALSLANQQKQSSEMLRQQMEERAVRAETQLKQLEADIGVLRAEQRKSPEGVLRQEVLQHQATIATLEKQLRILHADKDKEIQVQKELGVQVDRLTQLLHQEKRKQDEQKVQDLEALRLKYIAREERFVLDGDREELKAIKKQLDVLRQVQFSQNKELARLQQERADLLATGQYTEDSFVIQELTRLIAAKTP